MTPDGGNRRNVPTLINRAYGASFFWDGRAASLERQVPQPLLDPREMSTTPQAVVRVMDGDTRYRRQFRAAFGRPPAFDDVVRALASYVRSIRSGASAYDRFQDGERSALDDRELRGLGVFFGKARCWTCHAGMNFTDERFHNTGVAFRDGRFLDDGRYGVTRRPEDRGAFKTPTLRDVARTAPYMHDGSLDTLEAVIDHYDRGGRPNPALDPLVQPIGLSAPEKRALAAFLRALNGRIQEGR
jgi:cytochrome c peroxidase